MYSINNIPFENFGIIPGRIDASNIAASGIMDMPARIGKMYHDWTDTAGVEPYVLASEIRHGGRIINFKGYIAQSDKTAAYGALRSFYAEIDSFADLVPLVTPWTSHSVFIQEKVEAEYLNAGWLSVHLQFEEPVVPNTGILPAGAEVDKPHFDGVALDSLGMFLTAFKELLNRPRIKEQKYTSYQTQGFQITPPEVREFELEIIAFAPSFAELKQNIESLQKLMSAPGVRNIKIDGSRREVFNTKGFRVRSLKVAQEYSVCKIFLPLMSASPGEPIQLSTLQDNNYNNIVNDLNNLILVTT